MPSTPVCKCEDLLPVLTKIINNSSQSGLFPDIWKEALVFPLLKKHSLDVIYKSFRPVSNLSFASQSGLFPDIWKEALVFPLLKKHGLDVIYKSFRPVSNLSFASELIEKAAFNQIHGHLASNDFYPIAQSAYRRNRSTETTPLKVTNERYSVKCEQAARFYPCIV